jgi:hypothetical protein
MALILASFLRVTRPASTGDWTAALSLPTSSATPVATLAALGASASAAPSSGYHIPSGKRVSRALESISCSNEEVHQSDEEISRSTMGVTRGGEGTHRRSVGTACSGIETPRASTGASRWIEASPRCGVGTCCSAMGTQLTIVGSPPTIEDSQSAVIGAQCAVVDLEPAIVRTRCSAMVSHCRTPGSRRTFNGRRHAGSSVGCSTTAVALP